MPTPRIDAHHHLWRYSQKEYPWIDETMQVLRQDFTPAQLGEELCRLQIEGAIAVQARESIEETEMLLTAAHTSAWIYGVVGWLPLGSSEFDAALERFRADELFVGVREMTQSKAQGFLDQSSIDHGIAALTEASLSFDLILRADQMQEAARLADRHPQQRFVLDHAGKPRIRSGEFEPWATDLRELAKRSNVACKISGLATEAPWTSWTEDQLRPYLDVCVEAFGPQRLIAGSDWPVCLLASSYERWWQTLESYFSTFSAEEKSVIFGRTAIEIYGLSQVLSGKTEVVA
ncbi:MAG: amidohydrolase family protein [Acidobacteriaceae bacterium]|nr:amidohydrolase family protein [Acidobacteriaceae bacterium]